MAAYLGRIQAMSEELAHARMQQQQQEQQQASPAAVLQVVEGYLFGERGFQAGAFGRSNLPRRWVQALSAGARLPGAAAGAAAAARCIAASEPQR